MNEDILVSSHGRVAVITLNRPASLNAWTTAMREMIIDALQRFDADSDVAAIVMTGAGDRAFSAGQDLSEAHDFDGERAVAWVKEWERYYAVLRGLKKPLVMALNGTAAGSAFQVALLGDIRVGHPGVRMGQPEINAGIASTTGPWIMSEMLGMSRTIELTLTGRLMDADECHRIGLIHHIVPADQVFAKALEIATELAAKPPVAMRLDKQRFREMTEPGFRDAIAAGARIQREAYDSGEPARMMEAFFRERAK
ncbi:enoyl-CoA hydratase/isomerase family protein [Paraburkholderia sp. 22099]|jgi:enoyl-CoA hydratase|uniref:Enoyl-CoA hydratase/carnithine racemase n=1 Tax=Paraburkholderia terricola TaxID=169427 RepID=A0ABU1LYD7_9BURK|nr:enoyl-CoA hydratase/isomerase family protein [Paraburkholderia terricola]ORC52763.1 enoyl-CoA hydratase [Burkholderia sp. A27]AXE94953.1 enoyl-CoA hydratase/isomerase family protein [Paraburkholderia terricola]MDR6411772.1 enoyl-CoA hydratase/carnithine racemase [Paraburkholderia terricola]MDR6484340.1 enoyl-CoA hydratase/carnithine racemase [Paraburkholderia terricola]MDR6491606.1 enoyl-CoA hydratase/carnithine racemase [Paraburkholderia terricola]